MQKLHLPPVLRHLPPSGPFPRISDVIRKRSRPVVSDDVFYVRCLRHNEEGVRRLGERSRVDCPHYRSSMVVLFESSVLRMVLIDILGV